MNTRLILMTMVNSMELSSPSGYAIGVAIALFILAYLIYALVKPEKF